MPRRVSAALRPWLTGQLIREAGGAERGAQDPRLTSEFGRWGKSLRPWLVDWSVKLRKRSVHDGQGCARTASRW